MTPSDAALSEERFRELCQKSEDYVSMSENADQLVEKGITTVEEVCRTILVTD